MHYLPLPPIRYPPGLISSPLLPVGSNTKIPNSTIVRSLVPVHLLCLVSMINVARWSHFSKIPTYVVPTLYPLNRLTALTFTTNHIYIYISLHSTPSKSHICPQHQRLYCPFRFSVLFPLISCNSTYIRCISSRRVGTTYALLHAPPPSLTLHADSIFKNHGLAHHIWTYDGRLDLQYVRSSLSHMHALIHDALRICKYVCDFVYLDALFRDRGCHLRRNQA